MLDLSNLITLIQNPHKTLLILCGFPYAGKSCIAKEIQKSTDIVYVALDDHIPVEQKKKIDSSFFIF